jgi:hypothetical protein
VNYTQAILAQRNFWHGLHWRRKRLKTTLAEESVAKAMAGEMYAPRTYAGQGGVPGRLLRRRLVRSIIYTRFGLMKYSTYTLKSVH